MGRKAGGSNSKGIKENTYYARKKAEKEAQKSGVIVAEKPAPKEHLEDNTPELQSVINKPQKKKENIELVSPTKSTNVKESDVDIYECGNCQFSADYPFNPCPKCDTQLRWG